MKKIWLLVMLLLLLAVFAACDANTPPVVDTGSIAETDRMVPAETHESPTDTADEGSVPETSVPDSESVETVEPGSSDPDSFETETVETTPVETDPVESETSHAHAWSEWQTVQEATCTDAGLKERTCLCGETERDPVEALGHTEVVDAALEATCTAAGMTEGKHCTVCGLVLVKQESVAARGHTPGAEATCTSAQTCSVCGVELAAATGHHYGEWQITREPTEAEQGEKRRDCENCDEYEIGSVAALAHDHSKWNVIVLDGVEPTCTDTGLTDGEKCSGCGEILVDQRVIPAAGHRYGAWTETKTPTEDAAGEKYRECRACGDRETVSVAPLTHDHARWETVTLEAVAPTCTATGLTEGKTCSKCGAVVLAQKVIPAKGHSYGSWNILQAPTCTDVGEKNRACACGHVDTALIAATGHQYGSWNVIIPVTCLDDGLQERFCSCGERQEQVIVALGHTESGWIVDRAATKTEDGERHKECVTCGLVLETECLYATGSVGLKYQVNPDRTTCTITGIGTCTDNNLYINAVIDGYTVTAIGREAFRDCRNLTGVRIPDTVTTIDAAAFEYCENLVVVTLGSNVSTIGFEAFDRCTSLYCVINRSAMDSLTLGATNNGYIAYAAKAIVNPDGSITGKVGKRVEIVDGFLFEDYTLYAYVGDEACATLPLEYKGFDYDIKDFETTAPHIVFPDGMTSIPGRAFGECGSLEKITIPSSVTEIGYRAFFGCSRLSEVVIPDSVIYMGNEAFRSCVGLRSVTLGRGWTALGGEVFGYCTALSEVTIPEGIVSIGDGIFYSCSSLSSVTIPNSVTQIGSSAFLKCESLTSIVIPTSVESIGHSAFFQSGLVSITLPDSVTFMDVQAFSNCGALQSITLPNSLSVIPESAFFGCKALTSLVIPDGVTEIQRDAFAGCSSMVSVTIGKGLRRIGVGSFSGSPALKSVHISDIQQWCSIDFQRQDANPLYNRDAVLYLNGEVVRDIVVSSVSSYAFFRCEELRSVTFTEEATVIWDSAFNESGLESVVIPVTVTTIVRHAFEDTGLVTIVYHGTREQWTAITKDPGWGATRISYVRCTDGNVAP